MRTRTSVLEAVQQRPAGVGDVDYDVHGLASVRLLDASPLDAAAVRRQLGPLECALGRDPDITIRFVDRLQLATDLRLIGKEEAGFTDDAFLVLRAKHKANGRVSIPLEKVGGRCEIVCERSLPAVPYLIPILNLTILARGALPLHASAFTFGGSGVVTTGWSKGGKTEALLAFMTHGARYIGDEWVYVSADGRRVHGIPEPIRVWDWHLEKLPTYRGRVSVSSRARLRSLSLAAGVTGRASAVTGVRAARGLHRLTRLLEGQRHVDAPAEALFGEDLGPMAGPFDRLFLMTTWERATTVVRPLDPMEVAARMAFSLHHERLELLACYQRFRYAFPGAENTVMDRADELERALLYEVLRGKTTYAVEHPSPMSLEALFDAMAPYCQ